MGIDPGLFLGINFLPVLHFYSKKIFLLSPGTEEMFIFISNKDICPTLSSKYFYIMNQILKVFAMLNMIFFKLSIAREIL